MWRPGLLVLLAGAAAAAAAGLPLAAQFAGARPGRPLGLLLQASAFSSPWSHPCNETKDCCKADPSICYCSQANVCKCHEDAYWQSTAQACVLKGELGDNCTVEISDVGDNTCRPPNSECVQGHCMCHFPYYPTDENTACTIAQTRFYTTTIVICICMLFAAVAIGLIMQVRSNMRRRLQRRHYRHRRRLAGRLPRPPARRRPDAARRYSEEDEPDEPPPPYVPIFTTRSSGNWGKLPSYQEAVANSAVAENEAFAMEEISSERTTPAEPEHVTATGGHEPTPSASPAERRRSCVY